MLHQCLLSCPLSIALSPVLTYLCELGPGRTAVWSSCAVLWAAFAVIQVTFLWRRPFRATVQYWRMMPAAVAVAMGWAIVVAVSVVDLQIGDRLYLPMVSFDYSIRVAMISAMSHTFLH